jgi:hypothetical protein
MKLSGAKTGAGAGAVIQICERNIFGSTTMYCTVGTFTSNAKDILKELSHEIGSGHAQC